MPFKLRSKSRHHIPRQKHQVTNWRTYETGLRNRGSLTIWVTEDSFAAWKAVPRMTPGGQARYSDLAIVTALTLRAVFHTAPRQSEGLIGSIMRILEIDLPVPDHTTLSRRARFLKVQPPPRSAKGDLHLIIDSTGLKLRGAGEWLVEKHGTQKRRSWRKLHIGIDASTGDIVAFDLTDKDVDDGAHVNTLLDQIHPAPASFRLCCINSRKHNMLCPIGRTNPLYLVAHKLNATESPAGPNQGKTSPKPAKSSRRLASKAALMPYPACSPKPWIVAPPGAHSWPQVGPGSAKRRKPRSDHGSASASQHEVRILPLSRKPSGELKQRQAQQRGRITYVAQST